MAIPAGGKVGGGVGGGMASSGLRSCASSGSSLDSLGEVPQASPSQSAAAAPSSDSRINASGRETSYLIARCTSTAPSDRLGRSLCPKRGDSSAAPTKIKMAPTNGSAVRRAEFSLRAIETLSDRQRRPNIIKYTK